VYDGTRVWVASFEVKVAKRII